MSPLLTNEERARFVEWLENEAATGEGIAQQMLKIGTPDFLVKKIRVEVGAALIIAKKLRETHSERIG